MRFYRIICAVIGMFYFDIGAPVKFTEFGKSFQQGGWTHNGRRLNVNLMVIVLSGQAVFKFNSREHTVRRGEYVLIPRGSFYTAHTDTRCEYCFIHFACEAESNAALAAEELEESMSFTPSPSYWERVYCPKRKLICLDEFASVEDRFELIEKILEGANLLHATGDYYSTLLLNLELTRLMIECSFDERNDGCAVPELVTKIVCYINDNFDKPLTLSTLADEFFVSKEYIARLFRKHLNTSSSRFISSVKIGHAKQMIAEHQVALSQIAESLGFNDYFYFSKVFKKVEGISPEAYRKQIRNI